MRLWLGVCHSINSERDRRVLTLSIFISMSAVEMAMNIAAAAMKDAKLPQGFHPVTAIAYLLFVRDKNSLSTHSETH